MAELNAQEQNPTKHIWFKSNIFMYCLVLCQLDTRYSHQEGGKLKWENALGPSPLSLLLQTQPLHLLLIAATDLQMWLPFHLPTYPVDTMNRLFLSSFPLHHCIPVSNTNRHSLWWYQTSRPVKQATHSQHTLWKSREEIETKDQNNHPTKTKPEISV